MDRARLQQLGDVVAGQGTFVHVTHVNPDADGVGSALAMSRYLRRRGKDSRVFLTAPLPRRLAFLDDGVGIEVVRSARELPADCVFIVYDISTLQRLGPLEDAVRASQAPRVVFDHHDGDTDFDALAFIDADAGATAQLIFEVFDAWGVELTPELAVPLYVGLLADTGSFNYGKTSPRTHEIAGRLLEAGVDPLAVHGQLEGNASLAGVQVGGEVLAGLQRDDRDPRIAHATLSHPLWLRAGADALDSMDLVNHTISIEGVLAGVLLVEDVAGATRLSLRSKGSLSIVEVARSFGGGGHGNAAGATVQGPPDVVRPLVLARLRERLLEQLGPSPSAG